MQTTGVDLWAWRLLDVAGEPFVSTDGDGTVVAWNRAAERALGWPAKDALGQDFCELVVPPRLAPTQVVVVPIYKNDAERSTVMAAVEQITAPWKGRLRFKVG